MGNFINGFTSVRNGFGLVLKSGVFALLGTLSLLSQVSAQTPASPSALLTCTPSVTLTEGDLLPGGIVSFFVSSGPGQVIIDHLDFGTGLQSLTLVGEPTNASVNIPEFTIGTTDPVVVTFRTPKPGYGVNFTLRAASAINAAIIRVRCAEICTPITAIPKDSGTSDFEFFRVKSSPGAVTVSHIDDEIGLESLTLVGASNNARVNIPTFISGMSSPIKVSFTPLDPNQELKFTLRAENKAHTTLIYVKCRVPLLTQPDDDMK